MSTDGHRASSDRPPQTEGGRYLRQLRERAGLSQRKLAELANTSNSYLLAIERGYTQRPTGFTPIHPSERFLNAVADALRLVPSERRELLRLFGFAGRPIPGPVPAGGEDPAVVLARYPKEEWPDIIGRALGIRIRVRGEGQGGKRRGEDAGDDVDPGRSPGDVGGRNTTDDATDDARGRP